MRTTYLFLILILSAAVHAQLGVSPVNSSIEMQVGEGRVFPYTLTNQFPFPIVDVTLNDVITEATFSPIVRIDPGQTIPFNLTINKTQISTTTFNRRFIFSETRQSNLTNVNREVNITNLGFLPNPIAITDGDTIVWTNRDTIGHTVTSAAFDHILAPNQSASFQFNDRSVGLVSDRINLFTQTIFYQNRTTLAFIRNPDNDVNISLSISTPAQTSRLNLLILDPANKNFTIEVGNQSEGVLRIINPTSVTANNVTLFAPFTTFTKQGFIVVPSTPQFVSFIIRPPFNQSNLTYHIVISTNGSNVLDGSEFLDVFVPFKEIDQSALRFNKSNEIVAQIKELCSILPDSPICRLDPRIIEKNITVIVPQTLQANITESDVINSLRNQEEVKETVRSSQNFIKDTHSSIQEQMSGLRTNISEAVSIIREAKEQSDSANTKFIIFISIILVLIVIGVVIFIVRKQAQRQAAVREVNY